MAILGSRTELVPACVRKSKCICTHTHIHHCLVLKGVEYCIIKDSSLASCVYVCMCVCVCVCVFRVSFCREFGKRNWCLFLEWDNGMVQPCEILYVILYCCTLYNCYYFIL